MKDKQITCPEIEAMKSDFDEFVIEAEDFIKRQKGHGNQD